MQEKTEPVCHYLNYNTAHIELNSECDYYMPFTGKIESQRIVNSNIENLIISLFLFEPGSGKFSDSVATQFLTDSIKYCKEFNVFPNLKNVYMLYNDSKPRNIPATLFSYNVKLVFFPFFLMRSSLIKEYHDIVDWEGGNKKCVFIMGALDRPNRFPVLYEFYLSNEVELLDYSCYINYSGEERKILTPEEFFFDEFDENPLWFLHWKNYMDGYDITREELMQVYNTLTKEIDASQFLTCPRDVFDRSVMVLPKEWNDTSVVLVSETFYSLMDNSNYEPGAVEFTEKTWRPIATKKPFVTCSENDWVYKKLERLGFKTFLEYTSHPEKVEISQFKELSAKHHAELTRKRVSSFLKNLDKNKINITKDVEYNHNHWNNLIESFWEELYSECPPLSTIKKSQALRIFKQLSSGILEVDITN